MRRWERGVGLRRRRRRLCAHRPGRACGSGHRRLRGVSVPRPARSLGCGRSAPAGGADGGGRAEGPGRGKRCGPRVVPCPFPQPTRRGPRERRLVPDREARRGGLRVSDAQGHVEWGRRGDASESGPRGRPESASFLQGRGFEAGLTLERRTSGCHFLGPWEPGGFWILFRFVSTEPQQELQGPYFCSQPGRLMASLACSPFDQVTVNKCLLLHSCT